VGPDWQIIEERWQVEEERSQSVMMRLVRKEEDPRNPRHKIKTMLKTVESF
jgi:hypothetical protein